MKKALIIIAVLFLTFTQKSSASHFLGGEITWECITSGTNSGKMIFTIKIYCACYLGAASCPTSTVSINNPLYATYGGVSAIACSNVSSLDLSPKCYATSQQLSCGITISNGGNRAMKEYVYVSQPVQINGVPSTTGSDFWWSSCCRPTVLNLTGSGYWLRASMFPYTDPATNTVLSIGTTTGGASCYDSSPKFAERPATVICSGYPFTYNHNAIDSDLDSLHYEWTVPKTSATNSIVWKTGYSTQSQLPGTFHSNQNVPATIHGLTGEIKFTAIVTPGDGYHSTAVKVSSYKCRQKVAEIIRDIPVVLLACPPTPTIPPLANTPPAVVFKWAANSPTSIPLPAGDTVMAGDSVNFYITSIDVQFLPGFTPQTNYLLPSGSQFGTKYADTLNGCKYPPCATLDTSNQFYNDSANWWEGNFGLATRFSWKTDCNHLAQVNACFTKSNTYNFVFKVLDNWCPAPGMNFQTFAVTVIAPPAVDPPELKCAKVMGNGDVLLTWNKPVTKAEDTLNSFRKYVIYRSDSGASGPYDTLHQVFELDSLLYLDVGANVTASAKYYVIQGISSCNDQGVQIWSDTISGMRLTAQVYNSGNSVALNWNDFSPGNVFGQQTTGEYYVWQILNGDTTLIDTTLESWDTLQINLCYPSIVEYMITVEDTTSGWGCTSNSSISGGTVGDNLAPDPIILDEVSYDLNNDINLLWQATSGDIGMYYIYKGTIIIDSIPGSITNYTYTPSGTDPCIMNFSIQAKDTCDNTNQVGVAQNSMCMNIDDVILCDTNKKALISWNNYNPAWAGGSAYILIYRSDNNGPYNLIDSVLGISTSYADVTINQNTYYRYRMISQENGTGRTASSSWDSISVPSFINGYIIDHPDLRCVSWINDTTVRLTWEKALNPFDNFNRYHITWSNNPTGNPIVGRDSISGILTSDNKAWDSAGYMHVGADTAYYYFVESASGCDGLQRKSIPKRLKAMELSVTSISDSTNQLDWDKVSPTMITPNYLIWRDVSSLIGNSPYGTETAQDTRVVCNEAVTYRVDYPDVTGCVSSSKEVDGYFVDDTPPAKQFIDSVSMRKDTTFTAMVGWTKNPSSDVEKYYVMHCTPASYLILDTLNASSPLFYEDNANAPLFDITQYTVTAEDSCGNNNLSSLNFDCHATMFVNPVMDFCDQSIMLTWNAYENFSSGTGVEYVVYVSENGGLFVEVGRTKDAKYKYSSLVNGNNYCFYIQGWEEDGVGPFSSSSAVVCLDAQFIQKPEFAYLRYATVVDTNLTRMCMRVDLDSDIGEYWVMRSDKKNEGYKVVATVDLPDPLTPADSNFCFDDIDVNTNKLAYYYRIDVVDPCGEVGRSSNVGRTMLLNVQADNDKNRNILTWNKYEEWAGGVTEYQIWRGTSVKNMVKVRSLPLSQFGSIDEVQDIGESIQFIDDVSSNQNIQGNGEFCYHVVAVEGTATFMQMEPEVSKSNIVCAIQYPLFYVPNSFTPNGDGMNDYFMPKGAFHEVKSYSLDVFNRWGEKVYSTDNYNAKGWDGTFKGTESPTGAYVYIVRYTSADGQDYEKRGTVSITR